MAPCVGRCGLLGLCSAAGRCRTNRTARAPTSCEHDGKHDERHYGARKQAYAVSGCCLQCWWGPLGRCAASFRRPPIGEPTSRSRCRPPDMSSAALCNQQHSAVARGRCRVAAGPSGSAARQRPGSVAAAAPRANTFCEPFPLTSRLTSQRSTMQQWLGALPHSWSKATPPCPAPHQPQRSSAGSALWGARPPLRLERPFRGALGLLVRHPPRHPCQSPGGGPEPPCKATEPCLRRPRLPMPERIYLTLVLRRLTGLTSAPVPPLRPLTQRPVAGQGLAAFGCPCL